MVVMVTEASAAVHINPALLLLLDRFTPESSTGLGRAPRHKSLVMWGFCPHASVYPRFASMNITLINLATSTCSSLEPMYSCSYNYSYILV